MKQVLIFKTGEKTCSERPSYPGSFCPFMFVKNFGTTPVCALYGDAPLEEKDGWTQRLPVCMEQFRGAIEMVSK